MATGVSLSAGSHTCSHKVSRASLQVLPFQGFPGLYSRYSLAMISVYLTTDLINNKYKKYDICQITSSASLRGRPCFLFSSSGTIKFLIFINFVRYSFNFAFSVSKDITIWHSSPTGFPSNCCILSSLSILSSFKLFDNFIHFNQDCKESNKYHLPRHTGSNLLKPGDYTRRMPTLRLCPSFHQHHHRPTSRAY